MEYFPLLLEETQHRCFLFYGSIWMRYCLNVTVIAFYVIRKVDYLIVDLHIQTPLSFISEYWYFHTYRYTHQIKWYQKTQRNIPTEITLNLRLIITSLMSSDKWLEIQEECLAQTGVICYTPSTENKSAKSTSIQASLWVEFCELLQWWKGRQENLYC